MTRTVTITTAVEETVSLRPGQVTFFISVLNSRKNEEIFGRTPALSCCRGLVSSVAVRVPGRRSNNLSLKDLAMESASPVIGRMAGQEGFGPPFPLFGLLVRRVLPAGGAELRKFQLLGHRLLVPCGRVVPVLALGTGQRDDVPHSFPRFPSFRSRYSTMSEPTSAPTARPHAR